MARQHRGSLVVGLAFALGALGWSGPAIAGLGGFEYVSPVPGSRLVSARNNVILRPGMPLVPAELRSYSIDVVGSLSGAHPGQLSLSDDGRTLVFEPSAPYAPGEEVVVTVTRGMAPGAPGRAPAAAATRGGPPDAGGSRVRFDFFVSPLAAPLASDALAEFRDEVEVSATEMRRPAAAPAAVGTRWSNALPDQYPTLTVLASDHPAEGALFFTLLRAAAGTSGHLMIVDHEAMPLFYRRTFRAVFDFKPLPDGRLAYFTARTPTSTVPRYEVLNDRYEVVDSFSTGNGYLTDTHDLKVLPDGHALLMSYDPEPVRMDSIVPGGRADAMVTGLVVQELDRAHRVVFQWRSWDHFAITDDASPLAPLTSARIDYVHGNAIAVDRDGDLLISSRHLSEITKVSRRTGEVIWRMGPHATRNEFSFPDDPRGFSHQHDVAVRPDGHVTLFDNGNQLIPPFSRGVEYALDEASRTAHLVQDDRHGESVFTPFMGSYERFEDGSRLIGWGGATAEPKITELHADGSVAFELAYTVPTEWSYRVFRAPWTTGLFALSARTLEFAAAEGARGATRTVAVTNPGPAPLTINYFAAAGSPAFSFESTDPVTIPAGASAEVRIRLAAGSAGPARGKLYVGITDRDQLIAQDLELSLEAPVGRARVAPLALTGARTETGLLPSPPGTPLRFALDRPGHARIQLFDVGGRLRMTLTDRDWPAGEHEIGWPRDGLASGVYFVRLSAGGREYHRRLAVLR